MLGLLFVSMLWGPTTILKAVEIAATYESMLDEGLRRMLVVQMKNMGFSEQMGKWLVDSMPRLNVSHGHLIENFRGANSDAEPAHFELAFVGRAEEDIGHFLRLTKKIRGGQVAATIARCSRDLPKQPQMTLGNLRSLLSILVDPKQQQ